VTLDPAAALHAAGQWLASDPHRARRQMAQALRQAPDRSAGWFNYGLAHHLCGRPEQAIRAYRLGLRCPEPPWREIANNLSQDLLLTGRFPEGWQVYEGRPDQPFPVACRQWYGPAWCGSGLPPSPLLVVSEQGLGDTLMMLRFALHLAQQGIQLQLVCQNALVELIRHGVPGLAVDGQLVCQATAQAWMPLLSLPRWFGASDQAMPLQQGYLQLQPSLVQAWAERLRRHPGRRLVALHWQGNPLGEQSLYSRGRSLPLQALASLAELADLEFVSLQKGHGADQWPGPFAARQVAGQAAVTASHSFLDTAAVLANCDLLISADSAVVHLAGALALPAWVLLKAIPEWRWGLAGDRSYWYDSLRLFRQTQAGSWREPLEQISARLQAFRPGLDAASRMGSGGFPPPALSS
jgi:hypothetical protein